MVDRASFRRGRASAGHLRPPLVTVALITAVGTTAWRLGVFGHELALRTSLRYGFSGRALSQGRWGTVLTSQFLTRDAFMAVSICVSLLIMLGSYEMLAGSRRAMVVAVACGAGGPLVVAGLLGIGSALGVPFAGKTLSTIDFGASAITAGGAGAAIGLLGRRWLLGAACLFVLGGLVLHHQLADWEHLVSFPLGWFLGHHLGSVRSRSARARLPKRPVTAVRLVMGATAAVTVGAISSAATVLAPTAIVLKASAWAAPVAPGAGPGALVTPPTTEAPKALSPVDVVEAHYPTPSVGDSRRVLVVLPAGYAESRTRHYPVVELLHGDPGGPADVVSGLGIPELASTGDLPAFIGVAPDGHGPTVDVGDWADSPHQQLGAAVLDDLRRWVAATFRTNGTWTTMGISSGGYGAAYLGIRSPQAVDAVCALSGFFTARAPAFAHATPHQIDAASPVLQAAPAGPRTLLLVGTGDSQGVVDSKRYFAALRAAGEQAQLRLVPGTHDWAVWKAGTPDCIRFLLVRGAKLMASRALPGDE
jgi:S-formylglutathione hydrolase FrmB